MVSASDYENLIALGSYEPVEETAEKPVVMKEVYGKQKSPYKHVSSDRQTRGPRHRVVLNHQTHNSESESNEDELLNSLNDLSDIDQYIPKEKQQGNESERPQLEAEEEGWSI